VVIVVDALFEEPPRLQHLGRQGDHRHVLGSVDVAAVSVCRVNSHSQQHQIGAPQRRTCCRPSAAET
jgi:hypothetical protein